MKTDIFMDTVRTERFRMDYFRFGEGQRALVVIPGLSVQSVRGFANAVAEMYRVFTGDYTVYVMDPREDLPPVYPVAEMARDTGAAMRALGLEGADVFGVSLGGMIALDIALRQPELVRKLVLGSSSARVSEAAMATLSEWARLAKTGDTEELYMTFGRDVYSGKDFAALREGLRQAAQTVTREELDRFVILAEGARDFDVLPELGSIRCPVLALGSRDDRVLGPESTPEIAEALKGRPDFEWYMYDGYGHAAYDTAPDYRERILRFLR